MFQNVQVDTILSFIEHKLVLLKKFYGVEKVRFWFWFWILNYRKEIPLVNNHAYKYIPVQFSFPTCKIIILLFSNHLKDCGY